MGQRVADMHTLLDFCSSNEKLKNHSIEVLPTVCMGWLSYILPYWIIALKKSSFAKIAVLNPERIYFNPLQRIYPTFFMEF